MYKKLASYGGHQSNAMFSLAALAKIKDLEFDYYVKPLPVTLRLNPTGNLKYAIEMGMNLIEITNYDAFFHKIHCPEKSYDTFGEDTLLIRQGAAEQEAEYGVKELAQEIVQFTEKNRIDHLHVFIQSGTGTTALFLQKHLDCRVYTTPNIGSKDYLLSQFVMLERNTNNYPEILETDKKYVFGNLYKDYFDIWEEICNETGILFELLYDPKTLIVLDQFMRKTDEDILYIHSGGTVGNESMLLRYKRFFNS
jgi:1-aminocyclopropane-1-carboxylate deaminase